jgi:cystathionine beta-synthase
VSDRLAREIPGAFKPNQYSNPNGPLSHYESTGPEIWRDTDGKVTHFVAGVGTGGTISGTGKYLKEVSDGAVQVIGADPEGSVYSGGTGRPYLVEGVGEDFWPSAYDPTVVDRVVAASDATSFELTLRLAREEGLLVGGSSGLALAAALEAAKDLTEDDVIVVLFPDGGRGYLGKIFNDRWMQSYGFAQVSVEKTVADVLSSKTGALPDLVHVHPSDTIRDAVQILTKYDVSQVPVLTAEPPVVMGEVIGSLNEAELLEHVFSGRAQLTDSVGNFVGRALPLIGVHEPVSAARAALVDTDALLVTEDGKPLGVLTRHDLLTFLSE